LTVVNVDPHHAQAGWVDLDLAALGLPADAPYQMDDLLSGARFLWRGSRNYVALEPWGTAAHLFRFRRKVRTERYLYYFLYINASVDRPPFTCDPRLYKYA